MHRSDLPRNIRGLAFYHGRRVAAYSDPGLFGVHRALGEAVELLGSLTLGRTPFGQQIPLMVALVFQTWWRATIRWVKTGGVRRLPLVVNKFAENNRARFSIARVLSVRPFSRGSIVGHQALITHLRHMRLEKTAITMEE